MIESVPSGASVYVAGRYRGRTPLALKDVDKGSLEVEVKLEGYEDNSRRVYITGGKSTAASFTMKPKPKVPEDFVLVEAGSFQMGSTSGDSDEEPVHRVTIGKAFYISKYEVTFEAYDAFCEATGRSKPGDANWGRGRRPVIYVSWYDAVEYCNWLSRKEGLGPAYTGSGDSIRCDFSADGYRLPTEAEWEFAARGGNRNRGFTYSGSNTAGAAGWYNNNSYGKSHEVGRKKANELGLYDMSGNVWGWCWDWYDKGYYASSPSTDPHGSPTGSGRVYRGGCWVLNVRYLRAANRSFNTPSYRDSYLGFRLVRTAR